MTPVEFLERLQSVGVTASLHLKVIGPPEALDGPLRAELDAQRGRLLYHLANEMRWAELRGQRWGPAQNDSTPGIDAKGPGGLDLDARLLAASAGDDEHARAEREALQAEAECS